jgi:hypothetical protein
MTLKASKPSKVPGRAQEAKKCHTCCPSLAVVTTSSPPPFVAAMPTHRVSCGGPTFICPAGSGAPVPVGIGNYSLGGASDTQRTQRVAQDVCPPGSYCVEGLQVCGATPPLKLYHVGAGQYEPGK